STSAAHSATSAIGNVSGTGYAHATGDDLFGSAFGTARAYGIETATYVVGKATGYAATANIGGPDTIGTIYGYGHAVSTGYIGTSHARGISSSTFSAGY